MKKIKNEKVNNLGKKIGKYIKIGLFISMLIFIFIVSPRITQVIQDGAKFIYEVDSNYITRIVELILSVSLVMTVASVIINKPEK